MRIGERHGDESASVAALPPLAVLVAHCVGRRVRRGGAAAARRRSSLEPLGAAGRRSSPRSKDGDPTRTATPLILLGYYNRNKTQELDIPIGPDNRIEPDGPDYGQPTHFYTGRQHGVFAIKVPKDFGNKKLTWTLTANGQTSTISFWLNPPYWVNFYKHPANGNEPPVDQVRARRSDADGSAGWTSRRRCPAPWASRCR